MKTINLQKIILLATTITSIIFINSCSVSTTTSTKSESETIAENAGNTNFDVPVQTPLNMTVNQYLDIHNDYFRNKKYDAMGFSRWIDVAWRSHDWRYVDQLGKAVIRGAENDPIEFHVSQWISYSMIRGFLLKQEAVPEVKEAIAYHLNILHKYNSYRDAKIIFQALDLIKGFWTEEQIGKFVDDVFQFRELKQQTASKTKIPNADERLRQRAKQMIQDNPQIYSATDAEEKLFQKLKKDRQEAQSKADTKALGESAIKAMQAEYEEVIYTEKLKQISRRK